MNLREPAGKVEVAKRLLPVIGMISERIKRDAYLRKLAALISVDERTLHEELQRVLRGQQTAGVKAEFSAPTERHTTRVQRRPGGANEGEVAVDGAERSRETAALSLGLDRSKRDRVKWEDYLIGLLLQNPGLCLHVCGIINDGDFAGTDTRELYRLLNSVYQRDSSPSHQPFEHLVPVELQETVTRAQKCVESPAPKDGAGLVKEGGSAQPGTSECACYN